MLSHPTYDPNQIVAADSTDATVHAAAEHYLKQATGDIAAPLLNRATSGLYTPGSAFNTLTLLAAIDSGTYSLASQFSQKEAVDYTVNGEAIHWQDYESIWKDSHLFSFPMTLEQGYAYSDDSMFARAAVKVGADTWLDDVRRFGIATPGTNVQE